LPVFEHPFFQIHRYQRLLTWNFKRFPAIPASTTFTTYYNLYNLLQPLQLTTTFTTTPNQLTKKLFRHKILPQPALTYSVFNFDLREL